jgi:hypothetical protein
MGRLDEVDLSLSLDRREEEHQLEDLGHRLAQLRLTLGGLIGECKLGPGLIVIFEGWDRGTSGSPSSPHPRLTRSATIFSVASGRRCRGGEG